MRKPLIRPTNLVVVAFQRKKDFRNALSKQRTDWTPPGSLMGAISNNDTTYEVWKGKLDNPLVKQLFLRMQGLVPMFIEGGTPIISEEAHADDDRWTFYFLYQKNLVDDQTDYVFCGVCTVYRFWAMFPPTEPLESPSKVAERLEKFDLAKEDFDLSTLPCRSRISQFIVLPAFQGRGLGSKFYETIYRELLGHEPTREITVEDPNEAFDDMRDICDLRFLRQQAGFHALHINTSIKPPKKGWAPKNIVDPDAKEAVRRKYKIAPRQFARLVEMQLMSKLPESVRPGVVPPEESSTASKATEEEKHELSLWKLLLKIRIHQSNLDALGELEIPERIAKLDETVSSVAFDYARLLAQADRYETKRNGKRKADDYNGDVVMGSDAKKVRMS